MRNISRLFTLFFILLLGACATQQQPAAPVIEPPPPVKKTPDLPPVSQAEKQALMAMVSAHDRLYRVAAPLLINNAPLCKKFARNLLGFTAKNKYSYSAEYVNAAEQVLGLNDRLQVTGVLAGGGAAKAGVLRGDRLVSVEDQALPEGENAESQAKAVLGPLVSGRSGVKLSVDRKGTPVTLSVPLTHACAFGIELGNADLVNAYADGQRTMITRGMLAFTRNDNEVAYVLAKEMAHNVLGHARTLRMAATMDGIIDNLVRIRPELGTMNGMSGIKPFPAEVDAAADTLALYMLARADYDIDGAPLFWQRLADQHPAAALNGYTAIHPASAVRQAAMKKTIAEIKGKQARNAPLLPAEPASKPAAPAAATPGPASSAAQPAPSATATR
ncbi:MAG: hypothetical protein K0S28_1933 [Paucimonas sp.]|jgi:hypothetical protein|nr:hypothetical protein [Paucimonas sp.]